jgi:hypothetical protein
MWPMAVAALSLSQHKQLELRWHSDEETEIFFLLQLKKNLGFPLLGPG